MEDKAYFYSTTNAGQDSQSTCSPSPITQCYPCNPCSPDRIQEDGTQCYPCNPCSPDRIGSDGQCYPCNPCSPDRISDDGQCYPCNPCSPDRVSSNGSSSGGGCYITTACTSSMGLPDDCYELQLLRAFRDKRMRYDNEFKKAVDDYYRFAPLIVSKIDKEEERKEIYDYLYKNLVSPCVKLILENKEVDAMNHYKRIVYSLKDKYGF